MTAPDKRSELFLDVYGHGLAANTPCCSMSSAGDSCVGGDRPLELRQEGLSPRLGLVRSVLWAYAQCLVHPLIGGRRRT